MRDSKRPPALTRKPLTKQQREEHARRRYTFALAIARPLAVEFFESGGEGGAWDGYDDLADSLWNMAEAMAKRFR